MTVTQKSGAPSIVVNMCQYMTSLRKIHVKKKTSLRNQMSRLGRHLEKPKDCLRAQHSTLEVLRGKQNKLNHTGVNSNLCAY